MSIWKKHMLRYGPDKSVSALIFVKCAPDGKGNVVEFYRRIADGSLVLDLTADAFIGRNGLGKTREGDGKTPVGDFGAVTAFGILPDPGTELPFLAITPNTYACDEDCPHYNRIVDSALTGHCCKGEHMIDIVPAYNYGIALDYNSENVYPLGSAIFFHCKGTKKSTAGCVAVDETIMKHILQTCGPSPRICIGLL